MNSSKNSGPLRLSSISSEAMIGIGITIAALGLLCLLLGLAEHLRSVPSVAAIWFALGVVLAIVGGLLAGLASVRKRRG
jgi:hypothetical protein